MTRPLLMISVPTYNRPQMIEYFLGTIIQKAEELNVGIWVFDGSSNKETEEVVNRFLKIGYQCLHYDYSDDQSLPLQQQRVFRALHLNHAKYNWFTGDKQVIKPLMLEMLMSYLQMNYDTVVHCRKGIGVYKEYTQSSELYKDLGWYLTGWGNCIFRSDLFQVFCDEDYLYFDKIYGGDGFREVNYFWEAYARLKHFKALVLPADLIEFSSIAPPSTCMTPELFNNTWVTGWVKANDALPKVYDWYKDKVIKDWGINNQYYTVYGFINQRIEGKLNLKLFQSNKEKYCRLSNVSLWLICVISAMPKWLFRLIYCGRSLIKLICFREME